MTNVIVSIGLILALQGAETDFATNPRRGDQGAAWGSWQIHQAVIDDVNRIYKTSYVLQDALDKPRAREICRLYLTYWGAQYRQTTGKAPTDEVLARIWNGGPTGWRKQSTRRYWEARVKPRLNTGASDDIL